MLLEYQLSYNKLDKFKYKSDVCVSHFDIIQFTSKF